MASCTAPRCITRRTAPAKKARTCTASSPVWWRSSTRAALWCSAASTSTASDTETGSYGNRTARWLSRTGTKARRGARAYSFIPRRTACPSTRRCDAKCPRSAAGSRETRKVCARLWRSSPTSARRRTRRRTKKKTRRARRKIRFLRFCSVSSRSRPLGATPSRARRRSSRGTTSSGSCAREAAGRASTSSRGFKPEQRTMTTTTKRRRVWRSSRIAATISRRRKRRKRRKTIRVCASGFRVRAAPGANPSRRARSGKTRVPLSGG